VFECGDEVGAVGGCEIAEGQSWAVLADRLSGSEPERRQSQHAKELDVVRRPRQEVDAISNACSEL
jgi:hypothetical protein